MRYKISIFISPPVYASYPTGVTGQGPELPYRIMYSTLVTNPAGGVILIGGESESNGYLNTLWYLPHDQATWQLLPQELAIGRHYHLAFFVPDEIAQLCG